MAIRLLHPAACTGALPARALRVEPLAGLRPAESGSGNGVIRGAVVQRLSPATARLDEAELRERVRHPGGSTASASHAGEALRAHTLAPGRAARGGSAPRGGGAFLETCTGMGEPRQHDSHRPQSACHRGTVALTRAISWNPLGSLEKLLPVSSKPPFY